MTTGIYLTTDPDIRIRVERDEDFYDDPSYAPGVREALIEAYEAGEVYGVIVERRQTWARVIEQKDGTITVDSALMERWVAEEAIWSCVGYTNVAEEVAEEHFGLTVTTRTIG